MHIADPALSYLSTFRGAMTQQATSVMTQTNQNCYEGGTGCFSVYGFEYKPGFDDAVRAQITPWKNLSRCLYGPQYISWVSDSKLAWTILAAGMGPDPLVEISARPISQEPMVCSIRATRRGLVIDTRSSILSSTWECPKTLDALTPSTYRSLCT